MSAAVLNALSSQKATGQTAKRIFFLFWQQRRRTLFEVKKKPRILFESTKVGGMGISDKHGKNSATSFSSSVENK